MSKTMSTLLRILGATAVILPLAAYGHYVIVSGEVYTLNDTGRRANLMREVMVPVIEAYGVRAALAINWLFMGGLYAWGLVSILRLRQKRGEGEQGKGPVR